MNGRRPVLTEEWTEIRPGIFACIIDGKKRYKLRCFSCEEKPAFMLMLHDELWRSIVPDGRGVLCAKCMEVKLGRRLRVSDLKPCGITEFVHFARSLDE